MKAGPWRLRLRQLDVQLALFRSARTVTRPSTGWIREIRLALGMTTEQLAERMGIAQATAAKLEKSERDGTIALNSLRKAADALNCELVYALVPRDSLHATLEERAKSKARQRVARVSHTMHLENQGISTEGEQAQIEELAKEFLARGPRFLWSSR